MKRAGKAGWREAGVALPASVDSIPTSANKEDHVPMCAIAARKCREVVKNAQYVIPIGLICAAQALDLFTNLKPGDGTLVAYRTIRDSIFHLESDRILSHEIETMVDLVKSGSLLCEVESAVGELL